MESQDEYFTTEHEDLSILSKKLRYLFKQWYESKDFELTENSHTNLELEIILKTLPDIPNHDFKKFTAWFNILHSNRGQTQLSLEDVIYLIYAKCISSGELSPYIMKLFKTQDKRHEHITHIVRLITFLTKHAFPEKIVDECFNEFKKAKSYKNRNIIDIIEEYKKDFCDFYLASYANDKPCYLSNPQLLYILLRRIPDTFSKDVYRMMEVDVMYIVPNRRANPSNVTAAEYCTHPAVNEFIQNAEKFISIKSRRIEMMLDEKQLCMREESQETKDSRNQKKLQKTKETQKTKEVQNRDIIDLTKNNITYDNEIKEVSSSGITIIINKELLEAPSEKEERQKHSKKTENKNQTIVNPNQDQEPTQTKTIAHLPLANTENNVSRNSDSEHALSHTTCNPNLSDNKVDSTNEAFSVEAHSKHCYICKEMKKQNVSLETLHRSGKLLLERKLHHYYIKKQTHSHNYLRNNSKSPLSVKKKYRSKGRLHKNDQNIGELEIPSEPSTIQSSSSQTSHSSGFYRKLNRTYRNQLQSNHSDQNNAEEEYTFTHKKYSETKMDYNKKKLRKKIIDSDSTNTNDHEDTINNNNTDNAQDQSKSWTFNWNYKKEEPVMYEKQLPEIHAKDIHKKVDLFISETNLTEKSPLQLELRNLLFYIYMIGFIPLINTDEATNHITINTKYKYTLPLNEYPIPKLNNHNNTPIKELVNTTVLVENDTTHKKYENKHFFNFQQDSNELNSNIKKQMQNQSITNVHDLNFYIDQLKNTTTDENIENHIPEGIIVTTQLGENRLGVDYSSLNNSMYYALETKLDSNEYASIPNITEELSKCQGKRFFSRINVNLGFFNISLDEDSKKYTLFKVKKEMDLNDVQQPQYDYYVFNVLPFDIIKAKEFFQNTMEQILNKQIKKGNVLVYIDEIVIMTKTESTHMCVLSQVFKALYNAGFQIHPEKSRFISKEINCAGHKVIQGQCMLPQDEIIEQLVKDSNPPKKGIHFEWYLNLLNIYSIYMDNLYVLLDEFAEVTKEETILFTDENKINKFKSDKSYADFQLKLTEIINEIKPLWFPEKHKSYTVHVHSTQYTMFGTLTQMKEDARIVLTIKHITIPHKTSEYLFANQIQKIMFAVYKVTKNVQFYIRRENCKKSVYIKLSQYICPTISCFPNFDPIRPSAGIIKNKKKQKLCPTVTELQKIDSELMDHMFMNHFLNINCFFHSLQGSTSPCFGNWLHRTFNKYSLNLHTSIFGDKMNSKEKTPLKIIQKKN